MRERVRGIIGVTAAQMLLGTLGACVLESGADPLTVTFYRCAIGGLVLAGLGLWRGDLKRLAQLPSPVLALALLGGLCMVGNWVLFFTAMGQIGIALSTIVFHVQPFIVVLLGALVFGERLRAAGFAWMGLALAGLCLAIGAPDRGLVTPASYGLGLAATLSAAFLYAVVTIIAKGLKGVTGLQLALVQCFCGIALLAGLAPIGPFDLSSAQWGWFLLIGIAHTGTVYMLLYGALPKLPTAWAAMLLFFYPATAIVVDAVVYGHRLGPAQYAGVAFILVASLGTTLGWGTRRAPPATAA